MAEDLGALGREPSKFTSTVWSRLRLAQQGDRSAWSTSYLQYRRPLLAFIERRVPRRVDAELLTDRVVELILSPAFLAKADESKGRFRDLLFATARYQMANARRTRDDDNPPSAHTRVPFDDVLPFVAAPAEERTEFAAFYVQEVLDQARELHRKECGGRESPEAELLDLRYDHGLTQAEIAARVGRTIASVNTLLARGRAALKMCVREVLCPLSTSEEELEEEVEFLLSLAARWKERH